MNRTIKFSLFAVIAMMFLSVSAFAEEAKPAEVKTIEDGKNVKMNFTIKSEGVVLETTDGKTPFEFVYGKNKIIPGVDEALKGMKVGDKKQLDLPPDQAFGEADPKAVVEFPKDQFKQKDVKAGMVFTGHSQAGVPLKGIVKEVKPQTVILDFNHPLAGKKVQVDLEIIEIA